MTNKDLLREIGGIDADLILDAAPDKPKLKKTRPTPWRLLAACLSLFFVLGTASGLALMLEAAEYREAVTFFEENELSIEGLSREEIKSVYKDITMKTFSYGKTGEVLNHLSVELYDSDLGARDSDSLQAFWENRYFFLHDPADTPGLRYEREYIPAGIDTDFQYARISALDGETLLWKHDTPFDARVQLLPMEGGVLLYGIRCDRMSDTFTAFASVLSEAGEILWEYTHGESITRYEAALLDGDRIVLLGCHNEQLGEDWSRSTLFTVLGLDGKVLLSREEPEESYVQYGALVRLGDTYLAKRNDSELVSFSLSGEPLEAKTYLDGMHGYTIEDIIAYEGKVFISASQILLPEAGQADPFADLEREYWAEWKAAGGEDFDWEWQEDYTARIRERYISTLFVCDSEGKPRQAYRSVGTLPMGELSVNEEGALSWHIAAIDEAEPPNRSPALSSLWYDLLVTEFDLTFDGSGRLTGKDEVGSYAQRLPYPFNYFVIFP